MRPFAAPVPCQPADMGILVRPHRSSTAEGQAGSTCGRLFTVCKPDVCVTTAPRRVAHQPHTPAEPHGVADHVRRGRRRGADHDSEQRGRPYRALAGGETTGAVGPMTQFSAPTGAGADRSRSAGQSTSIRAIPAFIGIGMTVRTTGPADTRHCAAQRCIAKAAPTPASNVR